MAQTIEPKSMPGARGMTTDRPEHSPTGAGQQAVVLGPRDSLVGKLSVDGDLTVQGIVDGELQVSGDVDVAPSATVKAKLSGRNVSIRGNVTGDLTVKNRLLVSGSGIINGDVKVAKLQVEDGGTLNGNISMGAVGSGSGEAGKAG